MPTEECRLNLEKALGRKVDYDEMSDWADLIHDQQVRQRRQGLPADFLSAAAAVAADLRIDKFLQQRNTLLNKVALRSLRATLDEIGDDWLGFQAVRVGVNTPLPGGRLSVDAGQKAYAAELVGKVLGGLREAYRNTGIDMEKWANAHDNQILIAKAFRGETSDPNALLVAKVITAVREAARLRENRAGSARGQLEGYSTRQSYNPAVTLQHGLDQFIEDMLPRVDPERTFARDGALLSQLRRELDFIYGGINGVTTELRAVREELRSRPKPAAKRAAGEAGGPTLRQEIGKAEGRAETAETRQEELLAQLYEGEQSYGAALERYLDLVDRTRAAFEGGNIKGAREAQARLAESRMAMGREHKRVQDLHAQFQRAEGRALMERGRASDWSEHLNERIAHYDRLEGQLNKLNELGKQVERYTTRLREPTTDAREYLADVWRKISGNLWLKADGAQIEGVAPFQGATNIGKQRSARREIFYKDAESEIFIMQKYGYGSLYENVIQELQHTANVTVLMETFGPNAKANHDLLLRERKVAAQDRGDFATVRLLDNRRNQWQFAEIDGTTRMVNNPTLAQWAGAWRALQNMARLGGAWISSIGDVNNLAAELRYQGVGWADSYRAAFSSILNTARTSDRRALADLIGVGNEAILGSIHGSWHATDQLPGKIAKMSQLFFRLNLLAPWTDKLKIGAALTTARHFANLADRTFAALGASERRLLDMYGIDAERWDLLRTYGVREGADGTKFLIGDGVETIPLGEFYALATDRFPDVVPGERWLLDARDRLSTAWRSLLVDRADFAVVTPGARERAIMNMGTERGTVLGEALRAVMQFKSFPIAMMTKVIGRELNGHPITAPVMLRWSYLIAEMAAMGYMIGAAKDFLKGKEPRPLDDRKTWFASMAQGGGFGLYGDFLFGEYNRFDRSLLATLAGPTFGQLDDVASLWQNIKNIDDPKQQDKGARAAIRLTVGNMPYANLFWTRPALDMLILNPIYESLSPGYFKRQQQRAKKEGRDMHSSVLEFFR